MMVRRHLLFESFADPSCRVFSLHDDATGQIRCSNLCTEIIEYTSPKEIAVCNLASIALPMLVNKAARTFDHQTLFDIAYQITKNLNRVIDVNFVRTPIGVCVTARGGGALTERLTLLLSLCLFRAVPRGTGKVFQHEEPPDRHWVPGSRGCVHTAAHGSVESTRTVLQRAK